MYIHIVHVVVTGRTVNRSVLIGLGFPAGIQCTLVFQTAIYIVQVSFLKKVGIEGQIVIGIMDMFYL